MGISTHERPNKGGDSDTWITPQWILKDLGEFDLDPCCPKRMPWKTAKFMLCEGLVPPWFGRVFMNPPYSKNLLFAEKFMTHRNGIALVYARTETKWFQIYYEADAFLFVK
jgi:hypothetical protein